MKNSILIAVFVLTMGWSLGLMATGKNNVTILNDLELYNSVQIGKYSWKARSYSGWENVDLDNPFVLDVNNDTEILIIFAGQGVDAIAYELVLSNTGRSISVLFSEINTSNRYSTQVLQFKFSLTLA